MNAAPLPAALAVLAMLAPATAQDEAKPPLVELPTRELARPKSAFTYGAFALSADGAWIAATVNTIGFGSAENRIALWRRKTGKVAREAAGHDSLATLLQFSTDGKTLVSHCRDDGEVRVWDTKRLVLRRSFNLTPAAGLTTPLPVITADAERLVQVDLEPRTIGEQVDKLVLGRLAVWDLGTGAISWSRPDSWAKAFAVSPDGEHLVIHREQLQWSIVDGSASYRMPLHQLELVRLADGETVWTVDVPWRVAHHVAFSGDGETVLMADSDAMQLYAVADGTA